MHRQGFNRYSLYGEQGASLPSEFVHLERIFDRSSLHEWTIDPHAHPHMVQLFLVEKGGAQVRGDEGRFDLEGPALILVPATCIHAFRFDAGVEGWVLSLAADLVNDPRLAGLLTDLAVLHSARAICLAAHDAVIGRISWLLDDLDKRLGQGEPVGSGILAEVALVLASALEAVAHVSAPSLRQTHGSLVARFRALVEERYRDHWPITAYADALGTTPSTLTRAMRSLTGQSPADVLHDRLLLEAKRNLAFTGATVAQIGYALGFADPAYFARFFKARTGQTAGDFRRERGHA